MEQNTRSAELYTMRRLYEQVKGSSTPASQHVREEYINLLMSEGTMESLELASQIRMEKILILMGDISRKTDELSEAFSKIGA